MPTPRHATPQAFFGCLIQARNATMTIVPDRSLHSNFSPNVDVRALSSLVKLDETQSPPHSPIRLATETMRHLQRIMTPPLTGPNLANLSELAREHENGSIARRCARGQQGIGRLREAGFGQSTGLWMRKGGEIATGGFSQSARH